MPLKLISSLISPDLLFILASMGHGDELILADAHFPTSSICRSGPKEVRADGLGIPPLLEAVLELMPLDTYVDHPVAVMERIPTTVATKKLSPEWERFYELEEIAETGKTFNLIASMAEYLHRMIKTITAIITQVALMQRVPADVTKGLQTSIWTTYQQLVDKAENTTISIEKVERFKFYERAKTAFAIVHTGELAQYGNIILKKGVAL